jgi:hypothetical protein
MCPYSSLLINESFFSQCSPAISSFTTGGGGESKKDDSKKAWASYNISSYTGRAVHKSDSFSLVPPEILASIKLSAVRRKARNTLKFGADKKLSLKTLNKSIGLININFVHF